MARGVRYSGRKNDGGTQVLRIPAEGPIQALDPRLDLHSYSPSGMGWGHHGYGPSQLALALLADTAGSQLALKLHQDYKREKVLLWKEDQFSVSETAILQWLEEKGYSERRIRLTQGATKANRAAQAALAGQEGEEEPEDPAVGKALEKLRAASLLLEEAEEICLKTGWW